MYSSLHIGLCAVLYTLLGYWIFQKEPNFTYALFVGSGTVGLYSLHRLVGITKVKPFEHKGRFRVIKLYKNHIWIYFLLSILLSFVAFYTLSFRLKMWLILPAIISLGYALPLFGGKRIRDFDFVKIVLIALIWTLLCFVLPGISGDYSQETVWPFSIASVLFFIGITLPFDVRDRSVDESIGVATFATKYGEDKCMRIAKAMVVASVIVFSIGCFFSKDWYTFMVWSIGCTGTYWILTKYRDDQPDWYYSFALDGMIGVFYIVKMVLDICVR